MSSSPMHRLRHARRELVGGIGELGAEREQIALQRRRMLGDRARRVEPRRARQAEPGVAARRPRRRRRRAGRLFDARSPPKSDVSPASPVRV